MGGREREGVREGAGEGGPAGEGGVEQCTGRIDARKTASMEQNGKEASKYGCCPFFQECMHAYIHAHFMAPATARPA